MMFNTWSIFVMFFAVN